MNYVMEYNTPIKFKGDIIITDPCYLMREDNEALCRTVYPYIELPDWEKYFPHGFNELEYPDLVEVKVVLNNEEDSLNKAFTYAANHIISIKDYFKLVNGEINSLTVTIKHSPSYIAAKANYDAAMEEYHKNPHSDWDWCECGESLNKLGITHSIVTDTLYGDWSCQTFEVLDEKATTKPQKLAEKPLGSFCADSGMVGVFLVDEVMEYNPIAIKKLKKNNWCATFIDNFDGEIIFAKEKETWIDKDTNEEESDEVLHLVGNGNIKFVTSQTGF